MERQRRSSANCYNSERSSSLQYQDSRRRFSMQRQNLGSNSSLQYHDTRRSLSMLQQNSGSGFSLQSQDSRLGSPIQRRDSRGSFLGRLRDSTRSLGQRSDSVSSLSSQRPESERSITSPLQRPRLRSISGQGVGVHVGDPELTEVSCGWLIYPWCKSYPVTYQITTMVRSNCPLLCSDYMVARRSDGDVAKLVKHLRSQFVYNKLMVGEILGRAPPPLKSLDEDSLLLQCGLLKKYLIWVLEQPSLHSSHSLHAFLGCRHEKCPTRFSGALKHFPPYYY